LLPESQIGGHWLLFKIVKKMTSIYKLKFRSSLQIKKQWSGYTIQKNL